MICHLSPTQYRRSIKRTIRENCLAVETREREKERENDTSSGEFAALVDFVNEQTSRARNYLYGNRHTYIRYCPRAFASFLRAHFTPRKLKSSRCILSSEALERKRILRNGRLPARKSELWRILHSRAEECDPENTGSSKPRIVSGT